jgi:hypothetical protein
MKSVSTRLFGTPLNLLINSSEVSASLRIGKIFTKIPGIIIIIQILIMNPVKMADESSRCLAAPSPIDSSGIRLKKMRFPSSVLKTMKH